MNTQLQVPDYLVVLIYFAGVIWLGAHFSKKQVNTEEYFAGGRRIPGWAMGISLMATLISSITFTAYPGQAYASDWALLVPGLMVLPVMFLIGPLAVRLYRDAIGLSAYEYFEKRFGLVARIYTSIAFTAAHFFKMGMVFYLVSLAIASMTGWPVVWVIVVVGLITIGYTLVGGIDAVIWTDVIQGSILVLGGLITVGVLLFRPEGGPAAVMQTLSAESKISLGSFDWDFTSRTFFVLAFYGFFTYVAKYTTDQTVVQRYLVAGSDRSAIRGSFLGALLCIPVWALFMLIGSLLWAFYQLDAGILPEGLKADQIFPYFITSELPTGITGLVLAALLAAAMSTLSSDLNCLGCVLAEDYYSRIVKNTTDKQRLTFGRWAVLACGLLAIGIALLLVPTKGTALSIAFLVTSIISGGLAGLFFLAYFVPRANHQGLNIGIAACLIFTSWALLSGQGTIDLGTFNFTQHKYMIGVYSHLVLFVVGAISSLAFNKPEIDKRLTF